MSERAMNKFTCSLPLGQTSERSDDPRIKGIFYRSLRHPLLKPYNRLAMAMILLNLVIYIGFSRTLSILGHGISPKHILYLTIANFGLGIFIRRQQVINSLFEIATSVPTSWPLSLRWALAKIYHFGGIHVGAYFSGTLWLTLFVVGSFLSPSPDLRIPNLVKYMGVVHLGLLSTIMFVSLPRFRAAHHNVFEGVARLGNWTSLILFWVQSLVLVKVNSSLPVLNAIVLSPEIWVLAYLTYCVAQPWLKLRKVPVKTVAPSDHVAVSEFNYGVTPFAGSSTDLSLSPLFEWHAFANIPSPSKSGFRLCISRAGDWTGQYIKKKPKYVWVKGITTAGVGNIELLFKRVIWVATGSGIGPCMPHLLSQKVPSRLVWSTRNPRKTYGNELVDEILSVQPEATVWDTTSQGRPDLVKLAMHAYREFDAEAVIVIANKKITNHVNYELESRGIPCFGAIWDS